MDAFSNSFLDPDRISRGFLLGLLQEYLVVLLQGFILCFLPESLQIFF